jgi:hypothetical protein
LRDRWHRNYKRQRYREERSGPQSIDLEFKRSTPDASLRYKSGRAPDALEKLAFQPYLV